METLNNNNGSELDPNLLPTETSPEPVAEKLETTGCAAAIPIVEGVEKISLIGAPLSKSIQGNGDVVSSDDSESENENENENSESEESSSSSSAASSSSSDDDDDDDDDDDESSSDSSSGDSDGDDEKKGKGVIGDVEVEEGEISGSDDEKMASWCNIDDEIGDEDDEGAVGAPIRSKNEIQDLPPVPPVTVSLEPHHQIQPVGVVMSTLGAQVIVEGVEKHEPLNEGSILWLTESQKPLGIVDEVFGPVKNPYYVVRYNSEDEVPAGIHAGTLISFVPEFADHVLHNKEVYKKGYDASGANDEELDDEFEFSDDEKEAEFRRMQRISKRGVNDQNPGKGKKKNNRNQFSPKEHAVPAISNAPAAPLRDRGNHSSFSGTGQNHAPATTTVSPFPPLNGGPNVSANGVWTNGTSFPQQPQHVMPPNGTSFPQQPQHVMPPNGTSFPQQPQHVMTPNGFPTNGIPFYPQNTQFSHQLQMPGMPFQQQNLPNPGSLFPNMLPGVQPNIFAQAAMLAQGLLGQNQNQMAFGLSSPFSQIPPPNFPTQQGFPSSTEFQTERNPNWNSNSNSGSPYFPQQQGFPSTELQPERNPNWNSNSNSGSPSQFHPGSSPSRGRGRNTFHGHGRKGWRPAK